MPTEILQTLTIRKVPTAENPTGRKAFYHEDAYNPTGNGYLLSDFNVDIEEEYFHPKEEFGAFRRKYLWEGVTVIDEVTNTTYPPTTREALVGILISIGYTPFLNDTTNNPTFIIDSETNTISGTGTEEDPYQINATGGGSGGSSLQEFYDADPTNTQISDGVNTLILNPKDVLSVLDLANNESSSFGSVNADGTFAQMVVEKDGSGVVKSNVAAFQADGKGAALGSEGRVTLNNGTAATIISNTNATESRDIAIPDANGNLGVSVKINGTEYLFNDEGTTDNIIIGGSGVQNPLTETLDGGDNDIVNVNSIALNGGISGAGATFVNNVEAGTFNGGTLSGNNSGDQTTITGNAGTATALQTGRTIGTITGEATSSGSSFNGTANNSNALTLATVNSNVGTFGSATQVAQHTVNAKGLVTAASNVSIQIAESQVTNLVTDLAAKQATIQGATGIATIGTPSQLIRVNSAGTALEYYTPAYPKKVNADSTPLTGGSPNVETILYSIPINGGDFAAGNDIVLFSNFKKTGTAGAFTVKYYLNTTATLVGATQLSMHTAALTNLSSMHKRTMMLRASDLLDVYPPTQSAVNDETTPSNLARSSAISLVPSSNFVIMIVASIANVADSLVCSNYLLERK